MRLWISLAATAIVVVASIALRRTETLPLSDAGTGERSRPLPASPKTADPVKGRALAVASRSTRTDEKPAPEAPVAPADKSEDAAKLFDEIGEFDGDVARARVGDQWGFVNRDLIFVSAKYDHAWDFQEDLAVVQVHGLYGFVDRTGREVIRPHYTWAQPFCEGLALVQVDGKYGFITTADRFALAPSFDQAQSFNHGIAAVEVDRQPFFVDHEGAVLPRNP